MRKKPTEHIYVRIPKETREAIERAAFHRGYPHTITSIAAEVLTKHFAKASSK